MSKLYFGPGFSMTCAGQTIAADADGFVDREQIRMTPEIAAQIKTAPAETTKAKATTKENA